MHLTSFVLSVLQLIVHQAPAVDAQRAAEGIRASLTLTSASV